MHNPLRVVFDALEAGGWQPQGPEHKFRANCPAHEGDSHQLRVNEGTDGRALLYCHTNRCDVRAIVDALGLRFGDLFPDGHRNVPSARRRPTPVVREDPLAGLLGLLTAAGISYAGTTNPRFLVAEECPGCGSPSMWLHLRVYDDGDQVSVSCIKSCPVELIMLALRSRANAEVLVAAGL